MGNDDRPARSGRANPEIQDAEHLREALRRQVESYDALRNRRAVRALLAIDRRTAPARTTLARQRARTRALARRVALVLDALPHRYRATKISTRLRQVANEPTTTRVTARPVSIVLIGASAPVPLPGVEHAEIVTCGASNHAARAARDTATRTRGEVLCFLDARALPVGATWLDHLAEAIDGNVVAAAPLLVHPVRPLPRSTRYDGRIRALGVTISVEGGVPCVLAAHAGETMASTAKTTELVGALATCLVVSRAAYDDAGGHPLVDDLDAATVELCLRLRARGGRIVAVPSAVVTDHRPVTSRESLSYPLGSHAARTLVERCGPALLGAAAQESGAGCTRIVLTCAAPSRRVAPRWGDWHITEAFARALQRAGCATRVQTADERDDLAGRACDVHVVVRGLVPVRATAGQRQVLWVLSHPERVTTAECDAADLVLVASHRFAEELRTRTATPVEVMLQATDPDRFSPRPPRREHAHAVAFVGKTRDVLRPAVGDALAAGLRPAIYGSGWERFVDPALVVAQYVPNEDLPDVYSSVSVLLNDHWDTMRGWGFVSNRIFDALACGTPVVSDALDEITDIFGDVVPMWRTVGELGQLVEADLTDAAFARRRAARGRELVLAAHTFDHRAQELLHLLTHHNLASR